MKVKLDIRESWLLGVILNNVYFKVVLSTFFFLLNWFYEMEGGVIKIWCDVDIRDYNVLGLYWFECLSFESTG